MLALVTKCVAMFLGILMANWCKDMGDPGAGLGTGYPVKRLASVDCSEFFQDVSVD